MLLSFKYPKPLLLRFSRKYFLLPLAILVAASGLLHAQKKDSTEVAVNGILDLRERDFHEEMMPLVGEWEFYWGQLTVSPGTERHLVPVPGFWNELVTEKGDPIPSKGYATYRLKIYLPKDRDTIGLFIPDFYGSYSLFVNGEKLASEGVVDSTIEGSQLFWRTKVIPLSNVQSDTLYLALQMSNFELFKTGIAKNMLIGDYDVVRLDYVRDKSIDWALFGCFFMGGLFFFGFYLFGSRDKAALFFALFCIVYSLRMLGTNNYVLHDFIPQITWQVSLRLEYMTLILPGIFFSFYLRYLYPDDIEKYIIWTFAGISAMFGLVALVTPADVFPQFLPYYLFAIILFSLYCCYVFVLAARKQRPGAGFGIWGNIAAVFIFSIIILNYFGYAPPLRLVQVAGYISFFFLQSLVLSTRFSFALIKAKKDAEAGAVEKTNFLSTMSHEIRTPLNAVIGITELLKTTSMDEKELKENVELLSFSANNLLAIINDILDFNKLDAGKVQFESVEMDIPAIIQKVVKSNQSIASKKSIQLNVYINSNVPRIVLGDPLRLTQVLNNLMNNALKFTDYGYVTITVDRVVRNNSNVTLSFQVIDTGIGIPDDKIDHIFDAFAQADSSTTRNFGGTGLGLSISSRILALQGSELKVESKPGKGTVFYFMLDFNKYSGPLEEALNRVNPVAIQEQKKDIANASILLTEDNDLNIFFTKKHLEKWGAKVSVAHNGQEAVDMVDHNFDLILMDLQMPLMDGFEASAIIRQRNKEVPIIAFTANTESTVRERILLAGMNDIITKPFAPDMLRNIIAKYL